MESTRNKTQEVSIKEDKLDESSESPTQKINQRTNDMSALSEVRISNHLLIRLF